MLRALTECDESCQEEKRKREILYMNYVDAEENLKNAPNKFNNAQKDYIISAFGQPSYDDLMMSRYKNEIANEISNEQTIFSDKKQDINGLIESFNKNVLLEQKINQLIENTLEENNELINKIDKITTNIDTNERKVYYDDRQIENIRKLKKYNLYILIFIYIVFFTRLFIFRKDLINKEIIISFTILLIIPLFFIPVITRILLTLYNWAIKDSEDSGNFPSKMLFDIMDEFKLFFGFFYSPIDLIL